MFPLYASFLLCPSFFRGFPLKDGTLFSFSLPLLYTKYTTGAVMLISTVGYNINVNIPNVVAPNTIDDRALIFGNITATSVASSKYIHRIIRT